MANATLGLKKGDRIQLPLIDPETEKIKKEMAIFYSFFPDGETMLVRFEESGKLEKVKVADAKIPDSQIGDTFPNNLNNIKPISEGSVKEKPIVAKEEDKKPKISNTEVPKVTKAERVAQLLVLGKTNDEIIEIANCDSSFPGWYRTLMEHTLPKNENSKKYKAMKAIMAKKTDEQIIAELGFSKSFIKDIRFGMTIKDVYGTAK
jgi:hypothetical protein